MNYKEKAEEILELLAVKEKFYSERHTVILEQAQKDYRELAKLHNSQSNIVYLELGHDKVEEFLKKLRLEIWKFQNKKLELALATRAIFDEQTESINEDRVKEIFRKFPNVFEYWYPIYLATHWSNNLVWWADDIIGGQNDYNT